MRRLDRIENSLKNQVHESFLGSTHSGETTQISSFMTVCDKMPSELNEEDIEGIRDSLMELLAVRGVAVIKFDIKGNTVSIATRHLPSVLWGQIAGVIDRFLHSCGFEFDRLRDW